MKRREFMSGLVATATLAGPALAQDYVASVISQLEEMGFRSVRQERTLLGRVRIVGTRGDGRREIIVNPNNGEILRDLWTPSSGSNRASDIMSDKSETRGGSSGSNGHDDSGDDGESDDGGGDDSGGDDSGGDDSGGDADEDGGSSGSGGSGSNEDEDDDADDDSGDGDDDDDDDDDD